MAKHHHHHPETCAALLAQISDYIDGELEARLCAELEQHLSGCDDCQVLVDTTQKTISLFRRQHRRQSPALSPDISNRLWQALENAGCSSAGQDIK